MSDFNHAFFDAIPEAAVLVRAGDVAAANGLARHYLPQLELNAGLPACLAAAQQPSSGTGVFTAGPSAYAFRCSDTPEGRLILFHPAPQTALTDGQLDGALRQLRQFTGEFLAELGGQAPEAVQASLQKSICRLFRLLEHLELMQAIKSPDGVPFHPVTMDLAGLCHQTVSAAAPLLADSGTALRWESALTSLLIPGDPHLLQRLLLELISNAARAAGRGTVTVRLHRQGERAILTLSGSGAPPTPRQVAAMAQQDTDSALPLPGQGAGLGLPLCRHIALMHGGSLLTADSGVVLVSLPAGPLDPRAAVNTPPLRRDSGLSPLLVGLSDVLPASLFGLEVLD